MIRTILAAAAAALLAAACATSEPTAARTPQGAIDSLLAADRAYSDASSRTDLVSGLSAMFDADVIMPSGGAIAHGFGEAQAALRVNPENPTSTATWIPIGSGVSADGRQGYTYGWMTTTRQNSQVVPGKYLAYWILRPEGWRVLAYKRVGREAGAVSNAANPPVAPAAIVTPAIDDATREKQKQSLVEAEKAFSDEAQKIGLGPAFEKNGSDLAMNLGGTGFILGAKAIAQTVGSGQGGPATINWSSDGVFVADSGDLGVSYGFIRPNTGAAPSGGKGSPFFTVWRRAGPSEPWRYIAE